jgi:hypothetical protein
MLYRVRSYRIFGYWPTSNSVLGLWSETDHLTNSVISLRPMIQIPKHCIWTTTKECNIYITLFAATECYRQSSSFALPDISSQVASHPQNLSYKSIVFWIIKRVTGWNMRETHCHGYFKQQLLHLCQQWTILVKWLRPLSYPVGCYCQSLIALSPASTVLLAC